MNKFTKYSKTYRDLIFGLWYSAGRPQIFTDIYLTIPVDEHNRKPPQKTLTEWKKDDGWDERADQLDKQVELAQDASLVSIKVEILRKQMENSIKVSDKALADILEKGFDTSSSAVQAYFKATEEQRLTIGLSDLVGKLNKMTDDDIMNEIKKRLIQANESGQMEVLDGEIKEENNSQESTPDE